MSARTTSYRTRPGAPGAPAVRGSPRVPVRRARRAPLSRVPIPGRAPPTPGRRRRRRRAGRRRIRAAPTGRWPRAGTRCRRGGADRRRGRARPTRGRGAVRPRPRRRRGPGGTHTRDAANVPWPSSAIAAPTTGRSSSRMTTNAVSGGTSQPARQAGRSAAIASRSARASGWSARTTSDRHAAGDTSRRTTSPPRSSTSYAGDAPATTPGSSPGGRPARSIANLPAPGREGARGDPPLVRIGQVLPRDDDPPAALVHVSRDGHRAGDRPRLAERSRVDRRIEVDDHARGNGDVRRFVPTHVTSASSVRRSRRRPAAGSPPPAPPARRRRRAGPGGRRRSSSGSPSSMRRGW